MQTTYSYSPVFELQIIFSLKWNFSSQRLCFYVAPRANWSSKYCIPCGSCFCTEHLLCPQPWLDRVPSFPDPQDPATAALFPIQTPPAHPVCTAALPDSGTPCAKCHLPSRGKISSKASSAHHLHYPVLLPELGVHSFHDQLSRKRNLWPFSY